MKTKIKRDWYGRLKTTEELHNDSKFWLSEISFVKDEIRFLDHLLSSNYIDFLGSGLQETVETIVKKMSEEKKAVNTLFKLIKSHERVLSDLIETKSVASNTNYLKTHMQFEINVEKYFRKYKELKNQIFEVVEKIIRKKEQKNIALK